MRNVPDYAELQCISNFSFLRGASHAEELVTTAASLGYRAIGIADFNSLAGVVRAHGAAKEAGIRCLTGARLELLGSEMPALPQAPSGIFSLLVYPKNRTGYARLCRLLTIGKCRGEKGECLLGIGDFLEHQKDLVAICIPPVFRHDAEAFSNAALVNFTECARQIREGFGATEDLYIALCRNYSHRNLQHTQAVIQIADKLAIPLLATGDVYYHTPERRPLQDVLTCIRNKCSIQQAGFNLFQNAERHLKPPAEIARLFRELPHIVTRTIEVAEKISFSLDELRYEYPDEICPRGRKAIEYLAELTEIGAAERYPDGIPPKVRELLEQELKLIEELNYEKYFLTCYDIVKFARSLKILCQGRGAAANSAVCFCLGITSVDPARIDLLFARFVSKERNEPPDIDIDFEHERREEVIQYIYRKYGRERAGLTCEVVTYRHRSAVREVGKALGLALDIVDKLAKSIHRWTGARLTPEDLRDAGLNPADPTIENCLLLSQELLGFPRHLSQHVGGFIISQQALCETVPILNAAMPDRTIVEWDKDDIETLGMLKIDVLGLGMLTCIRKALELVNARRELAGQAALELHTIPAEDPGVYEMLQRADTVGVFQIESRAQMSMLPRLKPACFYDLVIEVAIVRPGPIQGNMVHPFLKRRNGQEKVLYPDARVEKVLGKTLGVPLFQEQAMRLVIELANFSPGEAERLRRSMAAWKRNKGLVEAFSKRIMEGMLRNGYSAAFAENCVGQIKGFSEYGFPESHAASFALLVYASSWLKKYHPAEFAAALMNSQPMGFYAPAQIVGDAKDHGVTVREIDVNYSGWDNRLEYDGGGLPALRLGMRLIKGLHKEQAEIVDRGRLGKTPFESIFDLWQRCKSGHDRLRKSTLQTLARADAFASLALSRRDALWEIRALPPEPLPVDDLGDARKKRGRVALPAMTRQQSMFRDYQTIGLSLKAHPMNFLRDELNRRFVSTAGELKEIARRNPNGRQLNRFVTAAGLAIIRQRPGTANGVVFITLEDETGIVNLIIRPDIFERHHKIIVGSSILIASGKLENVGEVVYISVNTLASLDTRLEELDKASLPINSYSY